MEDLLGNLLLSYSNDWGKHHLDALGLAEAQKNILTGFLYDCYEFLNG